MYEQFIYIYIYTYVCVGILIHTKYGYNLNRGVVRTQFIAINNYITKLRLIN